MKTFIRSTTLIAAIASVGCSTDQHIFDNQGNCLSCLYNPITLEPIGHNVPHPNLKRQVKSIEETVPGGEGELHGYAIAWKAGVGVDRAYLAIKREFGYQTKQELSQSRSTIEKMVERGEYVFTAMPGVHYRMRSPQTHEGFPLLIDAEIEAIDQGESRVVLKFWPDSAVEDPALVGVTLQRRAQRAIDTGA